jgi:uncharacterized protein (DUF433 family)
MAAAAHDLLDREVYGMAQVDRLLGMKPGTARRWIDGYERGGRQYPPVVRLERTGHELVTWGEFVETRLLSEFRDAGASMQKLRPAIDKLREEFHPVYPLAYARPFLDTHGRELVLKVQEDVGLHRELSIVVVRSGQIVLTNPAEGFVESAEFEGGQVRRIRPVTSIAEVVLDPLRQFGEPVVRGLRTEIVAEQYRAGESIAAIADIYELPVALVEAALRYELVRAPSTVADAA